MIAWCSSTKWEIASNANWFILLTEHVYKGLQAITIGRNSGPFAGVDGHFGIMKDVQQ